ncbi:MAG: hypothetical protein ACRESZ_05650 [Methylococcales bacterium]
MENLAIHSRAIAVLVCAAFTTRFKTEISAFVISGGNAEEILLVIEMQPDFLPCPLIILAHGGGKQSR